MSPYRVSDNVVLKTCWVLWVLICGMYSCCIICMAKAMKTKSGFTLDAFVEIRSDSLGIMGIKKRPELPFNHLTIYKFHISCLLKHCHCAGCLQSPVLLHISISISGQEQLSRQRKNVTITYSGEFRKPAPKSVLILVKSNKNHMVIEWIWGGKKIK